MIGETRYLAIAEGCTDDIVSGCNLDIDVGNDDWAYIQHIIENALRTTVRESEERK